MVSYLTPNTKYNLLVTTFVWELSDCTNQSKGISIFVCIYTTTTKNRERKRERESVEGREKEKERRKRCLHVNSKVENLTKTWKIVN